jgi:hypothetical protein
VNGSYLEWQIKQRVIGPVRAFGEYIFRDVLPPFGNMSERADKIAENLYEEIGNRPMCEDGDFDMADVAEEAHDRALDWYEMTKSVRQMMLNLLAAGLFHLVEQQLSVICQDRGFTFDPPKDTQWERVERWYEQNLRLTLKALPSYPRIDELRLVANTVKHGDGSAATKLRVVRAELFIDPVIAHTELGEKDFFMNRAVVAPMAGEDLFVTENVLKGYVEGAESFFREIADHFGAHADEYY